MGAYGIAVAAAFAVALAVLVSVSSTPTVEAADIAVTDGTATVEPGDTAVITQAARIVRFTIDTAASTATGSFASGGGQTLACSDDAACDTGVDGTGGDVPDSVAVKLDIDEDSADGFIIVKVAEVITSTGTVGTVTATVVITVKTQPVAASLSAKAASTTIQAERVASPVGDGTDPDRTAITATVKDDSKDANGKAHETLTFITTLGTLTCGGSDAVTETGPPPISLTAIAAVSGVQVCQVRTVADDAGTTAVNEAGTASVTLVGAGREGTATVTITHGTLDPVTVDVTFYGDADNVDAAAEQGSVEVSGSVFVVLTVTDAAGNPVKNQEPTAAAKSAIVGPKGGVPVKTDYGVNKLDSKGKVAIPACDAHTAVTQADVDGGAAGPVTLGSSGTNDDGQCVVQVTAPADDPDTSGTNEAATRGTHTLNFALNKLSASASVEVAGGPATIESDAPEYVAPLSDTTITVTVRDDEGVLVGETDINVIKVAGDGLAEGDATKEDAKTKNGSAKFSYAAGLEGRVVFRVIAGSGKAAIRDIITLTVGEPAPDEPDEPETMPSGDPTLTVDGNLGSFSGGSLAELAAAAGEACPGGAVIWAQDGSGAWQVWSSTAPAIANVGFTTAFADGFASAKLLWIAACEPDAMEDEG